MAYATTFLAYSKGYVFALRPIYVLHIVIALFIYIVSLHHMSM